MERISNWQKPFIGRRYHSDRPCIGVTGYDEDQSTSPQRFGSSGLEEKTSNAFFSFLRIVDPPWPGYTTVSFGNSKSFVVMDSMICLRLVGDEVLPGPPGNRVSPDIKYLPVKKHRLPAVCPGVCNTLS